MTNDITVIITLYKTNEDKIKLLSQYRNFKVIIFEQAVKKNYKNKIKKISGIKFDYYFSNHNIGLSRSSNFLLSKVKTKYFLFTQPDVIINEKSIKLLQKGMSHKKNIIFAGPRFIKNNQLKKKQKIKYLTKKKLDAACMLCNTSEIKKIGFFDEDFFLYWEDIFLMRKINQFEYKMVQVANSFANHQSGHSSKKNLSVNLIRNLNFKYGEYLFEYKINKLRKLKIIRQFLQSLLFITFNFLLLRINKALINVSNLLGILKFFKFYLKN